MPSLEGMVVAITGAGSGMGAADARLLSERGAKLVLGDLNEERLRDVANGIVDAGRQVAYVVTDVRRAADLVALVELAMTRFGKLEALISNAGVMPISPLSERRTDDWNLMVDVNVKGVLNGIAAALPVFEEQGNGHFVNMASTAAYLTLPNQAVYSGTKAAVRAISEGLRKEVGSSIRVTIVSPGYTATNFADTVTNEAVREQLAKSRDEFAMSPQTVAEAIAYALAQPADVDVNEMVIRSTAQP